MTRARSMPAWLPIGMAIVAGVVACGPNASYDGLALGRQEDPAVRAPRPLSPISVSTVATSRPRLKWALTDSGTGVVAELARSRAFLPADTKRFDGTGTELVIPEDLEPGIWFWRLRGLSGDRVSGVPSVTWEVLVRGPAANGSSDVPVGSIVDTDGDGEPDLTAVMDTDLDYVPSILMAFRGLPGGGLANEGEWAGEDGGEVRITVGATISGGTDFNGDGYPDLFFSGLGAESVAGQSLCTYPGITLGGPRRTETEGTGPYGWIPFLSFRCGFVPNVTEGGDIDGDGYGDVLMGVDDAVQAILGGTAGLKAPVPLFAGYYAPLRARQVAGAFDSNGDGLSDVVMGIPAEPAPPVVVGSPSAVAEDSRKLGKAFSVVMTGNQAATLSSWKPIDSLEDVEVSAFSSADFDGDGASDLAAIISGRVCFWHGDRTSLVIATACVTPPDGGKFTSLTATDLEGDGRDDLVAAIETKEGFAIAAIHLRDGGVADLTPIAASPLLGARLTTIWPGRPGKGRWAAAASDGSHVAVFEGTQSKQVITTTRGGWSVTKGFVRGIR